MLAGAVFGHAGHNFRRHILHVFDDHFSNVPEGVAGRTFLFSELLEPSLKRKALRSGFRFQRRRLFVGKLDYSHKKSPTPFVTVLILRHLEGFVTGVCRLRGPWEAGRATSSMCDRGF